MFILPFLVDFRGGKICLTDHFKPLWARNVPKFGIAHAMALGVCCLFATIDKRRYVRMAGFLYVFTVSTHFLPLYFLNGLFSSLS